MLLTQTASPSSLTLPSGKCGFPWPSSSQLAWPRPAQPRWSRGQTGQVSLRFGSYWASAFPTVFMFRGDSGWKEMRAGLLCRWSLVFWPECKLCKAKLSCLAGTPLEGQAWRWAQRGIPQRLPQVACEWAGRTS